MLKFKIEINSKYSIAFFECYTTDFKSFTFDSPYIWKEVAMVLDEKKAEIPKDIYDFMRKINKSYEILSNYVDEDYYDILDWLEQHKDESYVKKDCENYYIYIDEN